MSEVLSMHQCTSCGGMYLCAPTQCDCMPDVQEYSDWVALPATDYAALLTSSSSAEGVKDE